MEPLLPEDPAEIGGYPVMARIGAGGMGQVYLGLTAGGRHVALKVIREGFEGPEALARFRREVATVERVRSRSAAAMVGAGLDAPPYWLATEYVPGPTLRQAVAEHGPLPPDICLRLLGALAEGLVEMHGQGVQHRDLKPGNVILSPDGPRLIDFGIARGEGQTQITRTGAWNGTPGYVAPEVIRDQEPVPASDVFSLAGTVAYAATGRPPFGGGRIEAIIHRTLDGDIDLDGADPRVADLVRRCAEKEPGARITPVQLIRETPPPPALAGDPGYRRTVGAPPPPPAGLPDAVATGLIPAARLTAGRRRMSVRTRGAIATVIAVSAAFVMAAAQSVLDEDDPAGANLPTAPVTGDARTASGGPSAGRSPGADGRPPDVILVKQPSADFRAIEFSPDDLTCLPALSPEDRALSGQLQVSAPRRPHAGQSIDFGMRFKYERPSDYYVAAQVRPPGPHGSAGPGWVQSKPHLYPAGDAGLDLTFPDDFRWDGSGAGAATVLREGVWTVVWMHVHPNGDAYYIGCDGFTVQ